ncbi:MAG: hypothetical protein KDB53_00085, partial [Planctomycetes bacterium]|nr:hypothetical protein [Planctomycetota bacterium]
TMNHAFAWLAIALAMFGFGLAGVLMSLWPVLRRGRPEACLSFALVAFAGSALLSHVLFARLAHLARPEDGLGLLAPAAPVLALFVPPFFFAGWGTARALSAEGGRDTARLYAIDLVGAGIGCLAVHPLLVVLGAERGLALIAGLAFLAAWQGAGRALRFVIVLGLAAATLAMVAPTRVFDFRPDPTDQFQALSNTIAHSQAGAERAELEFGRWDPVGRVEVHRLPGSFGRFGGRVACRFFSQDAGAGSIIVSFADDATTVEDLSRGTLYGLAAHLKPGGDALVIGLGGGPDLVAIRAAGVRSLTGCEINGAVLEIIGDRYRRELGLPRPGTEGFSLVHADGRGFVRSRSEAFDLIQMTGADTYAAASSGGSVLTESYLYTEEAFVDHLKALRPDGLLCVTRFAQESLRAFETALSALAILGVEAPEKHLAFVTQGPHDYWGAVLCKRSPFTAEEIGRLRSLVEASGPFAARCKIPAYDAIGFAFDTPMRLAWHPAAGIDLSVVREANRHRGYDLSPVSDDRPFFFQFRSISEIGGAELGRKLLGRHGALNRHHGDIADYLVVGIQLGLLAIVLLLVPFLFVRRRRGPGLAWPLILVFGGLGAGFMLLEVGLMQRFSLMLGHPNHAISTVLASMLISSGLGSLLGAKVVARGRVILATVVIAAWVFAFRAYSQVLIEWALELSTWQRALVVAGVITPLGLALGIPFPAAVRLLVAKDEGSMGLAWGINGFSSVVASLATVPLAMVVGFQSTFVLAVAAYLVALFGFSWLQAKLRG